MLHLLVRHLKHFPCRNFVHHLYHFILSWSRDSKNVIYNFLTIFQKIVKKQTNRIPKHLERRAGISFEIDSVIRIRRHWAINFSIVRLRAC